MLHYAILQYTTIYYHYTNNKLYYYVLYLRICNFAALTLPTHLILIRHYSPTCSRMNQSDQPANITSRLRILGGIYVTFIRYCTVHLEFQITSSEEELLEPHISPHYITSNLTSPHLSVYHGLLLALLDASPQILPRWVQQPASLPRPGQHCPELGERHPLCSPSVSM